MSDREYADLKRNDRPPSVRFTAERVRRMVEFGAGCESPGCRKPSTMLLGSRGVTTRFCDEHGKAAKLERAIRHQRWMRRR
jgi:hypothetical protein